MKEVLGHGVTVDSDVDAAFDFLRLVGDLVGKAKFESGVPTRKDVFRLAVVEGRDDFSLAGEESEEDEYLLE